MATGRGIRAEHGLSFLLEADGRQVLFDCGQSDLILHNAAILGMDWAKLEAVALSHGHYDHTGGLLAVLEKAPAKVIAHPDVWGARYSRGRGNLSAIGCHHPREVVAEMTAITEARTPLRILDKVWLSGEIPRISPLETIGKEFYLDQPGRPKDPILDDQAIYIETDEGLLVLLGCAHSGVINTLEHAKGLFPQTPLRGVIGGMHLIGANEARIQETIRYLRDVPFVTAGHCTGWRACHALQESLGDRFSILHAGKVLSF